MDCLIFTLDFIKNKRINEVNSYCGSFLPYWRPNVDFRKSYSANKVMGGGVHIDLIHEMDYLYWFFGMPEKVNATMSNKSSLNISAYDYANYTLEYPSFNVNLILNYYRVDAKRSLEILTSEGTIYVDLLKNKVLFNDKVIFTSQKTVLDTYEDQLKYFMNTVLKNKKNVNSINEAFEILKLCLQKD
nr:Gfo/Idh/MocA family oxidoreductase [Flavobacterium sp. 28A]